MSHDGGKWRETTEGYGKASLVTAANLTIDSHGIALA